MLNSEQFNPAPFVKKNRLNVLPSNPETASDKQAVGLGRFPSWLHRKLPKGPGLSQTEQILTANRLPTVCEEAKCPNLLECWSKKTATFLVMGKACTRSCGFCDINFSKTPPPLEKDEPARVADSVEQLGLKHAVITMVARDDLPDGGAGHLVNIVRAIRQRLPHVAVELLTSDFSGNRNAWDLIIDAQPDVFNHNIETVRELTPRVRHTATYQRTLDFLRYVKMHRKDEKLLVKSGLMLGLGESEAQVLQTLHDLRDNGCDIVTMGQYLQPNRHKLRVKAFIHPDEFKKYEEIGYALGFKHMYCGPFVRSSYNASEALR